MLDVDVLGAIRETALTPDIAIEMQANGLPNTFVPGRNLVFLTFAGALAYRRGAEAYRRRHVRDRLFRLSRLPRRHHEGHAARARRSGMDRRFVIETPLMWIDKAATLALAQGSAATGSST